MRCVGAKKKAFTGRPDKKNISTSFVERQNLTMRMHMRRFTRLTNAFSKKVENHAHAVALHFMYYNFVRIHKTLRCSPAMAARVTETYNGTLEALVLALDARDRETKGHSLRVTQYALTMARQMGVDENSKEWVDLQRGALLHDVGKIGVPDYILHKPGPLTPEEWDEMKRHPHIGHGMLKDIAFLSGAASIVEAHHERFDGKGYPNGLAGSETPLGARIFTIADAFDAMTSDRPYRKALSSEEARNEVLTNSGTQFDPKAVQAFLLVFDELIEMAREEHAAEEREHVTPRAA